MRPGSQSCSMIQRERPDCSYQTCIAPRHTTSPPSPPHQCIDTANSLFAYAWPRQAFFPGACRHTGERDHELLLPMSSPTVGDVMRTHLMNLYAHHL